MGPPSYMRSVVGRNVVMRRMPVYAVLVVLFTGGILSLRICRNSRPLVQRSHTLSLMCWPFGSQQCHVLCCGFLDISLGDHTHTHTHICYPKPKLPPRIGNVCGTDENIVHFIGPNTQSASCVAPFDVETNFR